MQYPRYQALGWPIGSGSLESANKGVVQARLKGAGMRWQRSHVNPMLALRTAGCLDQWEQAWQQACNQRLLQRPERRLLRQQTRRDAAMSKLRQLILRLLLLRCPRLPVLTPIRLLPSLLLAPLFPLLPADQLLTILGAVASSQKNDTHPSTSSPRSNDLLATLAAAVMGSRAIDRRFGQPYLIGPCACHE